MSTRCQLAVYPDKTTPFNEAKCFIYRHNDGYPEAIIPDILDFLKSFHKERGLDDIEYASARLCAKFHKC